MTIDIYMKRCFELAERGKGCVAPNPLVGAVLVHNDRIIGEGWHRRYGERHAEVDCLASVSSEDRSFIPGSTMYVNLEPCAHTGKTPPCAPRLVSEGIGKVVIANEDPFEVVNGKGIDILRRAGVQVETGILANRGAWLNRRFFCFHRNKRPHIILKWAQTTDGYFAPPDRSRFQVSNMHSMQLVHKWRTEEAAIMVGTTTALNDDPQLTARRWDGKQPLRIVLDELLRLPPTHHVFDSMAPTLVVNALVEDKRDNITFSKIAFDENLISNILELLHARNILSLIVEGGARLISSFIAAQLWDEARVFTGNWSLGNGIVAPLLADGSCSAKVALGSDELRLFVNNRSCPYVPGMAF